MHVFATDDLIAGNFSRQLEGQDCGDPGLSIILVDAEPGRATSLHAHPYAEIMIIQEGTATITDGSTSREIGPGEVVIIPGGELHALSNAGEGQLRQINVHAANAFVTDER